MKKPEKKKYRVGNKTKPKRKLTPADRDFGDNMYVEGKTGMIKVKPKERGKLRKF